MEEQTLIYTGPVNNYENFWKFPFNICIWISYPLHINFFKQVSKISGKVLENTWRLLFWSFIAQYGELMKRLFTFLQ